MRTIIILFTAAIAAACSQPSQTSSAGAADGAETPSGSAGEPPAPIAAEAGGQAAFDAIRADETIRFIGTEPFWGGNIGAGQMLFQTPENEAGETIAVTRFAGNSGLGFSGTLNGQPVDLAITPGTCSDGMSDRSFPFTATLKLGDEQRNGCAWTDRKPFTGAATP